MNRDRKLRAALIGVIAVVCLSTGSVAGALSVGALIALAALPGIVRRLRDQGQHGGGRTR
jgi:hypothetical protein